MAAIGQAAADLTQMSALELAEAIRSKRVSSEDVIEAHLRRIDAVNPSISAVTVVLGEGRCAGPDRLMKRPPTEAATITAPTLVV